MSQIDIEQKLEDLKTKYGLREPIRDGMEDEDIKWRYDKPNYVLANYEFLRSKSQNHAAGSLEELVENLVKTWEMEASHKSELSQWSSVDHESYEVSCNGSDFVPGTVVKEIGNYNALLQGCKAYQKFGSLSFEGSHDLFRDSFPEGFPWEVLTVMAGPPHVLFSWRHWGTFKGHFQETMGHGQVLEMYGMARVTVNQSLKIQKLEVFLDGEEFLAELEGKCPLTKKSYPTFLLGQAPKYE